MGNRDIIRIVVVLAARRDISYPDRQTVSPTPIRIVPHSSYSPLLTSILSTLNNNDSEYTSRLTAATRGRGGPASCRAPRRRHKEVSDISPMIDKARVILSTEARAARALLRHSPFQYADGAAVHVQADGCGRVAD